VEGLSEIEVVPSMTDHLERLLWMVWREAVQEQWARG
jgi:hypothetical protein